MNGREALGLFSNVTSTVVVNAIFIIVVVAGFVVQSARFQQQVEDFEDSTARRITIIEAQVATLQTSSQPVALDVRALQVEIAHLREDVANLASKVDTLLGQSR